MSDYYLRFSEKKSCDFALYQTEDDADIEDLDEDDFADTEEIIENEEDEFDFYVTKSTTALKNVKNLKTTMSNKIYKNVNNMYKKTPQLKLAIDDKDSNFIDLPQNAAVRQKSSPNKVLSKNIESII